MNITLWILQIFAAGMFLLAGGLKLAGAAPMVAMFEQIGIGQWFRYFTGGLEVACAVLLLIPGTSDYAPGEVRVSFLVVTNRGKAVNTPTADVWVARSRSDVPFTHTVAHLERIGVPEARGPWLRRC